MSPEHYNTEEALDALIAGFEDGTFPKEKWDHQAHIVAAACYLVRHPLDEATAIMRRRIPAYNIAQGGRNTGTSGYHETLTVFWMRIIARFLDTLDPARSRVDKVRCAAEQFGPQRDLFRRYYSFDVVNSLDARRRWIEPDVPVSTPDN